MPDRVKKTHPALKHGGYATTTLLPGEDPAAFKKLHQALIAELAPSGELENDIVATMARLVWRKKNLVTFRIAELARKHSRAIHSERDPQQQQYQDYYDKLYNRDPADIAKAEVAKAEVAKAHQAAEDQARRDLGDIYELLEIGEIAKIDQLMQDLAVEERLDSLVDKCLKRLLFLRGLKSISLSSSSAPLPLIQGPSKAA